MHIYGPAHLHGPQSIGPPHAGRAAPGQRPQAGGPIADEVQISDAARVAEQAQGASDIRHQRVAAIRAEIAAGTYETPERLEGALERLLDEIG